MGRDGAEATIPGTLLAVLVVVTLGAGAYAYLTSFQRSGPATPVMSFAPAPSRCSQVLTVAAAPSGVRWQDLRMLVEGADEYAILALDVLAVNGTWSGAAITDDRLVAAGDAVEVALQSPPPGSVALLVLHVPSGGIAARAPLEADATIPAPLDAALALANGRLAGECEGSDTGVFDPGFAYEDPNNDFLFTAGLDIPIPNEVIRAGAYASVPGNGLVIPPSVGPIRVPGAMSYRTTGAGFTTIAVDLESGSTLRLAAGQDVRLLNVTARSAGESANVAGGRGILASGSTVAASKTVTITSPGRMQLNATHLASERETIDVKITREGALWASGVVARAQKTINLEVARGSVLAERADLTSVAETINLLATGAGGTVRAERATLTASLTINVNAARDLRLAGASLAASESAIHLRSSSAAFSLDVSGARLDDANDVARVEPTGLAIVGTPAFGRASYAG